MRIAVLGSGTGSNLQALIEAQIPIALVISDKADAGILTKAAQADIPTHIAKTSSRICHILKEAEIELICLAGFMRLIKEPLLSAFPRRILNIHPSLLPAYPGLEAWRQALDDHAKEAGCTIHYIDAGIDTGEIIAQTQVPILPHDTPASLHTRIQEAEHQLYPKVIREHFLEKETSSLSTNLRPKRI